MMWHWKSEQYVAKRKDVCAGILVGNASSVEIKYDYSEEESEQVDQNEGQARIESIYMLPGYRGMLFDIDDNGLTHDLIWTTPTHYPVQGLVPKIDEYRDFFIQECVEIDELLKYLNFGVDLTQRDLNYIYRLLIVKSSWLRRNSVLFGSPSGENKINPSNIMTRPLSLDIYEKLRHINLYSSKPNKKEPGYDLIKRIK